MCWNCGCKIYDDDMGDKRNLTNHMVKDLAKLNDQKPSQAAKEIREAADKMTAKFAAEEAAA